MQRLRDGTAPQDAQHYDDSARSLSINQYYWCFFRQPAASRPTPYNRRVPTLLAFIPHPDDEAYSFAGTVALASAEGWRCLVHCASSGERGKRHDVWTRWQRTRTRREAELRASCRAIGAGPPEFWGLPDGALKREESQAARFAAVIDRERPALVLGLGADGAYGHPDHLAVQRWLREGTHLAAWRGFALLEAVFPQGLFLTQYEKCIRMMGDPPSPARSEIGSDVWDVEVDISEVIGQKRNALASHRSQLRGGDPEALFPPGIVAHLMERERFSRTGPSTAALPPWLQKRANGVG